MLLVRFYTVLPLSQAIRDGTHIRIGVAIWPIICYYVCDKQTNMHTIDPSRHLVKTSLILVVVGFIFFFFGLLMDAPVALSFTASILFPGEPTSALGVDPSTTQGIFLLASILIVFGAGMDVWRRLHLPKSSFI